MKSDVNLRGWKPDDSWHGAAAETLADSRNWDVMAPLLKETAKAHKRMKTKEMTVTELELKISLVEEEEGRAAPRASRVELALSSNLEKEESVETRETLDQRSRRVQRR